MSCIFRSFHIPIDYILILLYIYFSMDKRRTEGLMGMLGFGGIGGTAGKSEWSVAAWACIEER